MTDETWLHYFDPKTKKGFCIWEHLGSPAPKKAMVPKSKEIFFTNQHEMTITHAVTFDQTVNVSYVSQGNILQAICHI